MQNVKSNKKIQYVLNRRINSTIKLDKLINHQQRIQRIKQNVKSYDKLKSHSKYSNQSFNRNLILPQINLKPIQKINEPINSIPLTQSGQAKQIVRLNSQQVEQIPKKQRQRITTTPNAYKQQTNSQRNIKIYLNNLLLNHYDPNLSIHEQIRQELKQIKSIWWNLVLTILQNIIKSIKNIELCRHLATAYLHIEDQITQNENSILKIFDDQHHQSLISEVYYYEKVLILMTIINHQQLSFDKSLSKWLVQSIRYIIDIKKYMTDILLQKQEHFSKFNKIKKPSYLIRQKKLIQINRIMNQIKDSFNKIKGQNYAGKFNCFQLKYPSTIQEKKAKFNQLKKQLLQIPQIPFINLINPKEYMIVLNPQHLFFEEDKKNTCIILKQFAYDYIHRLSNYCEIVLFFHKRIKNKHPFLHQIDQSKITKVLDSSHYTYKQAKKIIDLHKFGYNPEKIIVIDINTEKWSHQGRQNCIVYNRLAKQSQIKQIFQKLLSLFQLKQTVKEIVEIFKTPL